MGLPVTLKMRHDAHYVEQLTSFSGAAVGRMVPIDKIRPNPEQPRKAGVWQTFDITLVGRTVTVVHDEKTIIDHKEIPGITGGALDSHEGEPGPIYLQGSEDGHVLFRKITLTPAIE